MDALEAFLEPFPDFVADFVRQGGRLDLHNTAGIHCHADAGNEFVGINLRLLVLEGNRYRVENLIHFLLRNHSSGENEFFRVRGIDLACGEPFEGAVGGLC